MIKEDPMKKDTEMIVHRFPGDVTIYPISDVHLGAAEHMTGARDNFCQSVLKRPNVYLLLNGDLINNSTRSSVGNIFEETMRPRDQKKRMVEMLDPLRDRILCITTGNHERRSVKDADDDPTYDIACKLDLEDLYRPNIAFLKLMLGTDNKRDGSNRAQNCYYFAVTHGSGGGIYTGATVNRNERFGNVVEGLDCLVVGHTHKGVVSKPQKLVIDPHNNQVLLKHYTVVSSVSWMAYGGYAMQKMLLPSHTGEPQKIELKRNNKKLTVTW